MSRRSALVKPSAAHREVLFVGRSGYGLAAMMRAGVPVPADAVAELERGDVSIIRRQTMLTLRELVDEYLELLTIGPVLVQACPRA